MTNVGARASAVTTPVFDALLTLDQGLLDALPTAICVCSADGVIVRFNSRAADIWGTAPRAGDTDERFNGAFRLYRMDGGALQHADTPMQAALRSGEPQRDREVLIERPDGSRVIALVNVEPFKTAEGVVQGAVNCFQDITERKRAEDGARKSERHFRGVLDALPAAIYTTDTEGTIDFYNRAAAELAGREPELGKDKWCVTWQLYGPDGTPLEHESCPMATALKERRPVRGVEAVAERPDGKRIPFAPFPTPLYDATGGFAGAVNMLIDISEQRQTEDRIHASEARYRGIFEGARVALWDQDFSAVAAFLDGLKAQGVGDPRAYFDAHPEALAKAIALVVVRNVNDYAVELFEAGSKQQLLGALGDIFLPETARVFLDEMVCLWEGGRRFESEAVVRTLKGKRLTTLVTIAWEGERCERSLVSILDISKQKASQHRFEALNGIAKTLSSDLDLERIVQSVTDSATKLSGAKFGAFFYNVTDAQGERYVLYTLSGIPPDTFEKFGMPRNTAVFGPTFEGLGIVRSDDITKDPRYGRSAPHYGMPKGHFPVVSYLAVPVMSRSGEVIGGLFFGHDEPGIFTEEAEEIVAGIASHAALAIDNARLLGAAQNEVAQRRQAEETQSRLASIVASSNDAIISKDLNGVIQSWNPGAERLFGYTAEEAVGKPVTMLIPDDHQNEEPQIIARIRRGDRIEHYETVRQRKDGGLVEISLSVSPVKDGSGTITGASKIARDITEHKRAQRDLARRAAEQAALYRFTDKLHRAGSLEEIYDAALEVIGATLQCGRVSILLFDEAKHMRFAAWRNLSQAYRDAVEGHSPWAPDDANPEPICIPDIARAEIPEKLKAALRDENIGALSFIPLVANGRLIGKFMTYYDGPHEFTKDEADLALNAARQLAFAIQKKRTEEERNENEERLRLATQTGKVGLWEWNMRSNRLSWTDSLYGIHGVGKDSFDATVEGFSALVHPEDRDRVAGAIAATLQDGTPYEIEFRIQKPDGNISWVFTNAVMLREAGKPVRMVGASFDITERKEAEAERALLLAELSHRVKNTLATVISIAQQSFSRGPSPAESLRSFDGRIRGLAQTHSRLAERSWSSVGLDTIVSDELMPYRREDGGNVRVAGPDIPLNAKAAVALGMAFHELATNAAKHGALSTEHGAVDIAWAVELPAKRLRIEWVESGGPEVAPPTRSGFGRLLLERALASDLRGEVGLEFAPGGLRCTIAFPLDECMAPAN